jgi:hypothetical protein
MRNLPNVLLVGLSGPMAGRSFPLGTVPLTIGRSPESTISLYTDAAVSRNHAQIYVHSGSAFIADVGSSNGTVVNGLRLTTPMQLSDGDVITIGPHSFRVQASIEVARLTSNPPARTSTCPQCRGSQVISLHAVTAAGISKTVGQSMSVGGAHILHGGPNIVGANVGMSRNTTTTELAKLLAFPVPAPKQVKYSDPLSGNLGVVTFLLSSAVLSPLFGSFWIAAGVGLVFGAIVTGVLQSVNKARIEVATAAHNQKQEKAMRDYEARKAVYDRSYYCPQCHLVFDPATGKTATPEQLITIL